MTGGSDSKKKSLRTLGHLSSVIRMGIYLVGSNSVVRKADVIAIDMPLIDCFLCDGVLHVSISFH